MLKRNAVDRFRKRRQDRIEQRQDREFNESDVNRVPSGTSEGGQFAPKDSGTQGKDVETSSSKNFGGRKPGDFADSLKKAKSTVDPQIAWRVFAGDEDYFANEHKNAKFHVTEGGSTVAVDDGDIIGVCRSEEDSCRGSELIRMAVEAGGNKLDSYAGNHGFYVKCGFEPVSWCEWNDEYAPDDWDESIAEREPVIFYKYVGKGKVRYTNLNDFLSEVRPSEDYDTACEVRNNNM